MVEAFPWDEAPRYLLRDRDNVYDTTFRRRVHSLGIEEVRILRMYSYDYSGGTPGKLGWQTEDAGVEVEIPIAGQDPLQSVALHHCQMKAVPSG